MKQKKRLFMHLCSYKLLETEKNTNISIIITNVAHNGCTVFSIFRKDKIVNDMATCSAMYSAS